MSLRDSLIRRFIVHEPAVILLCDVLRFLFRIFMDSGHMSRTVGVQKIAKRSRMPFGVCLQK